MAKKRQKHSSHEKRSPCPVACTLDIFGDRWTLLVIRDLFLGKSRYKELVQSPERIPTNILADRLRRLVDHEIITTQPIEPGAKHLAYFLTPKGEALRSVILAMKDWSLEWLPGTAALLEKKSGS